MAILRHCGLLAMTVCMPILEVPQHAQKKVQRLLFGRCCISIGLALEEAERSLDILDLGNRVA